MKTKELKYILDTKDTRVYGVKPKQVLYRIIAMKDIDNPHKKIKKGEKGGYIVPDSLSQEGTCWVDEGSYIFNDCTVSDNAYLENSVLDFHCSVSGNALVVDTVIFAPQKTEIKDYSKLQDCQLEYNLLLKDKASLKKCQIIGTLNMIEQSNLSNCIINCYGSGLTFDGENALTCMEICGEGSFSDSKANIKKTRLRAEKLQKVL